MGLSLNQRGLFKDVIRDRKTGLKLTCGERIASRTEQEIFERLGTKWRSVDINPSRNYLACKLRNFSLPDHLTNVCRDPASRRLIYTHSFATRALDILLLPFCKSLYLEHPQYSDWRLIIPCNLQLPVLHATSANKVMLHVLISGFGFMACVAISHNLALATILAYCSLEQCLAASLRTKMERCQVRCLWSKIYQS